MVALVRAHMEEGDNEFNEGLDENVEVDLDIEENDVGNNSTSLSK